MLWFERVRVCDPPHAFNKLLLRRRESRLEGSR